LRQGKAPLWAVQNDGEPLFLFGFCSHLRQHLQAAAPPRSGGAAAAGADGRAGAAFQNLGQTTGCRGAGSSPLAILSPDGVAIDKIMNQCGITGRQASPRGLRHAFGVGTLQSGVSLSLVQRWLGHARMSTTAIYADVSGPEEVAFAAKFWG
jgi:hypothetical protein